MAVIKLHDVKAAAVSIEVDVPFFKIWCDGFPESYLGIKLLNFAPGSVADSFAVGFWRNKEQV